MRPSKTAAFLATLSLGSYACGDPLRPVPNDKQINAGQQSLETGAFTCTYARQDPDDPAYYHYGWIRFHIPKKDYAGNTGMVAYQVLYVSPGKKPGAVLNCELPNSPTVLAYMSQNVARVGSKTKASGASATQSLASSTSPQLSVSSLDPILVIAPYIWYLSGGGGMDGCNNWCYDSSHEDTGGGYYEPPPPPSPDPAETCFQRVDPTCNQPLTDADQQAIWNMRAHFRDVSTMTDANKAKMCWAMVEKFQELLDNHKVFRGRENTVRPDGTGHWGAFDPESGTFHFDPLGLDQAAAGNAVALTQLANTALHESAHLISPYYSHSAPGEPATDGNFTSYPFNLIGTGPDQCLVP